MVILNHINIYYIAHRSTEAFPSVSGGAVVEVVWSWGFGDRPPRKFSAK